MVNYPLRKWIAAASIKKHISFHCFQHTSRTTHKTDGETTYASNIKDYSINKEISNHHTRMSIDDLEEIFVEDVEWQKASSAN